MAGAVSESTRRRVALARRLGASVVEVPFTDLDGRKYTSFRVSVADNEKAIEMFNAFAHSDAQCSADVKDLAARFVRVAEELAGECGYYLEWKARRDRLLAERIHRYIRDAVRFTPETVETSRSPELTIKLGIGDCDEHAALGVALALAGGLRARLYGLRNAAGAVSHAVAVVEVGGRSYWSETTVAAEFGEHPRAAVARLGAQRDDVGG